MKNRLSLLKMPVLVICSGLIISNCSSKTEKAYSISVNSICECFANDSTRGLDNKLEHCTSTFDSIFTELSETDLTKHELKKLEKNTLEITLENLSKTCDSFRDEYIQLFDNKFGNLSTKEATEIIDNAKKKMEVPVDTLTLANAYLSISEGEKANELLNVFISTRPTADYALWMNSYVYYKEKRISESLISLERAIKVTKHEELKSVYKYLKNSIEPIGYNISDEILINIEDGK